MAISDAQQLSGTAARVPRTGLEARLAIAGVAVCIGAVALAAEGSQGDAAFGRALLEALIVGVPIAVGLYALRAPINASFGIALLGIGFAWSLTALTESSLSVPYTIGRLSTWLIFPCVVYLLLAFPDGRIDRGFDRAILVTTIVVFVVLFLGTAPLVEAFPPKTLWGTCTTDCPPNAVFVLDAQPALLTKMIYAREWLVELLWIALIVSMFQLPFATYMMRISFESIPRDLEESALIDGCGTFDVLWRIMVPSAVPGLVTVGLFAFLAAWNEFFYVYVLIRSDKYYTLAVGLYQMVFTDVFPLGEMMAASILMAVPVLILYGYAQKFMVEGLTLGSVKG
jgi:hypothetical protein